MQEGPFRFKLNDTPSVEFMILEIATLAERIFVASASPDGSGGYYFVPPENAFIAAEGFLEEKWRRMDNARQGMEEAKAKAADAYIKAENAKVAA